MIYHSTRDNSVKYTSKQAILKGLCEDGGLFVADELPAASVDIKACMSMKYEDIAFTVFKALLPDFSDEELRDCVDTAYVGKFETEELTPVTKIGENWLLELYHGPTSAFKDMALCMLPKFMQKALYGTGEKVMIVTATSGDTGKAALEGFRDVEDVGIAVFYPHGKVSDIQYLQMASQEGNNVYVSAVEGNFDDCQTGVKKIFSGISGSVKEEKNVSLSSANSINIGRLVPQVVYYIYTYKKLLDYGRISFGDKVDFCVPTGNFGDVLAGYYAKLLGLPVGRLIVASNENNVLTDFIKTGTYNKNRAFVKTISPSMDILVSSNLERLLYYASGCDCGYVAGLMKSLSETGEFTVSAKVLENIQQSFDCGFTDDRGASEAIRYAFEHDGRLIDTHTAVAYKVLNDMERKTSDAAVILSTASPFKFAKDVYMSISGKTLADEKADGFAYMDALTAMTGEKAPAPLAALKTKNVRHKSVVPIDGMAGFVLDSVEDFKAKQ